MVILIFIICIDDNKACTFAVFRSLFTNSFYKKIVGRSTLFYIKEQACEYFIYYIRTRKEGDYVKNQLPLPEKVLSMYPYKILDIKLIRVKRERAIWKIGTDQGMLFLKKVPRNEAETKFILAAVEYLREKGVHFPEIYSAKNNQRYVKDGNDCYILLEAIEGEIPRYQDESDILHVTSELAKFHRASAGFKAPLDSQPLNKLENWEQTYLLNTEIVSHFHPRKNALIRKKLTKKYQTQFLKCLKRIDQMEAFLKSGGMAAWKQKIGESGGLCHQDFNRWNLRVTPAGDIYILDIDTLAVDLPATDIRSFVYNYVRVEKTANPETIYKIFENYHRVNPLTAEEWEIVKKWLLYPRDLINLCKKYRKNRDEISEKHFIHQLKWFVETEMKLERYLKDFDKKIIKVTNI
jgi:spore coat-associated protein S